MNSNYYNVLEWKEGNAHEDIGAVLNSIIADIKNRQNINDVNDGGKPGAVIFIPSGDYHLRTQVVIDVSFLKIIGSGHGFISSSIRFNTPESEFRNFHDVWPGGSRIIIDIPGCFEDEAKGAAFYVDREGSPRISSVEFCNFCIDGLHFIDNGDNPEDPENSYVNGKTGIYVACAHDSFRFTEMGLIYLEHGLIICNADALTIHDNFIAECGNCIELRGHGQASKVTDNLMGAGYRGYSLYAENMGGLLVSANNIFPRGKSSVHLHNVRRSNISSNRFHSFYPGMIVLDGGSSENLVSSNHILRDHEPWQPMFAYDNGLSDDYGLIRVEGNMNSIISNHISETINPIYLKPHNCQPVIIRIASGYGNQVLSNHITATANYEGADGGDSSCFIAQIGALLSAAEAQSLYVKVVVVDEVSVRNIISDTCCKDEIEMDFKVNAFRALPEIGA